jgi:iron complex transport system substrate-binding protein
MNSEGTKGRRFGFDLPDGRTVSVPAEVEALAAASVDAALAVHRELGPGLLESAYEACLAHELESRGIRVQRQLPVPLDYRGVRIEVGFRADLLLDTRLLLELKAAEAVSPLHRAQVITYLKLLKLPLGLLINFNSLLLKDGLERILNVPRRHP